MGKVVGFGDRDNLMFLRPGETKEKDGWVYRCEGDVFNQVITGYKTEWKYVNGHWQEVQVPIYSVKRFKRFYRYRKGAIGCYRSPINFQCSTVTGGTSYTFHDCTPPQNYNEVGGYPNMAWLDMTFTISNELNGNPSVSCLVKGRKVYDIRTGITAYSTNPALCLRDFLLSKRYGLGKWFTADMLDTDSWIEAADYCDEQITFLDGQGAKVTAKRYELNMVIDSKRTGLEWVQEILANFCGYLVYSGGKLKLKIEKQTPVSYKFTDDNCFDLKISPLALSETPNRYEVTIIDPLNNWSAVKCICDDYADQKERQRIVTKAVSLEGVTSQNQALRLARFYRDYNLVCPIQLSFTTGMQGMHLEPGDVVTVSYHGVFKEMPIRITEIKETNKGTFEISGRQYNDTIYGDILGGGIHWYNYSTMQTPLAGEIPEVINLQAVDDTYVLKDGTKNSTIKLTWEKPSGYQFTSSYTIDYSLDDGATWIAAGSTRETNFSFPARMYWTHLIRVRVENTVGRLSAGEKTSVYVSGKNNPPQDVVNLKAELLNQSIHLTWDANADPDLKGYNVYMGINGCEKSSCELVAKLHSSNTIIIPIESAEDYISYVEAVDTAGNVSENAAYVNVHLEPLPVVTGFYAVKNGDNINFYWDKAGDCNYEIRWGNSWKNGQLVAKVNSNVYTHFFPLVGTHSFFIKAYNGLGLYSRSASYVRITLTPAVTRNVIAEFDERANGWRGAKNLTYIGDDCLIKGNNAISGEYYTNIRLDKEVDARNWIEFDVISLASDYTWTTANTNWQDGTYAWLQTEGNYRWCDAEKAWTDYEFSWKENADEYPVEVSNYIAQYKGVDDYLYTFDLNENTDGAKVATGITYADGKFRQGAVINNGVTLDYAVNIPAEFNLSFNAKHHEIIDKHIVYMTLEGSNGWMRVEYKDGIVSLLDSAQNRIEIPMRNYGEDALNFYVQQNADERILTVNSIANGKTMSASLPLGPMGTFTEMRLRA